MKKRIIALAAAVSMLPVLPLTGCGKGGTYETPHFQFTAPDSWVLEQAEELAENNYLGYPAGTRYTFKVDGSYYIKGNTD